MSSLLLANVVLAAAAATSQAAPPPELPASVYRERRARVLKALDGCIGIVAAQGEVAGVTDEYRQDADFYWLTGINEPQAYLLLTPKAPYTKVTLFLKPRDPEAERWTGPREPLSPELMERYGVDKVRRGSPESTLESAGLMHDCVAVLAPPTMKKDERNDAELATRAAQRFGLRVVNQRGLLGQLRAAHSPEEIERMERALAITRAGHEVAAASTVAGVTERNVQTKLEYAFFNAGATGLSYSSIVGAGPNGAILHWTQNSRVLKDGDLVVVDAAAEYGRYAADVTRTYPVSGKFTAEQAKVYRAVYQAQEDIFAAIKPGASMADLQRAAEDSVRRSGYLAAFIHGFGHFVGLNVHDSGLHEKPMPVGAILTVEPGIYLPEQGFGVRIEDEVLITPTGYKLLTSNFPRKLEDVEAWVAKARSKGQ